MQFVLLSAFLRMKNKNMPEKICRETFTNRKLSFVSQAALLDTSTILTERPMPSVELKSEKINPVNISVFSGLVYNYIHLTYIEKVWPTAPNNPTSFFSLSSTFLFDKLFLQPLCIENYTHSPPIVFFSNSANHLLFSHELIQHKKNFQKMNF